MTTLIGDNASWSKRARGSTQAAFSPNRALRGVWALQRDRWILWLPPVMIVGAAAWLLAPADPPVWLGGLALVMAAVAFGAILLDRPAISMRGLALAALIVILMFPESVLDASFQMSFAATMALVALFELLSRPLSAPALPAPGPIIGFMQWSTKAVGDVLLISLVAGIATDPFAMYHFQRFSLYALPANLLAEPILSFLVAPAAIAAAVLAPFGLSQPALEVMASGLDLIAAIGQTFGERSEAVQAVPNPPDAAFLVCAFALLWACLWRGALRWFGVPIFAVSVALYITAPGHGVRRRIARDLRT